MPNRARIVFASVVLAVAAAVVAVALLFGPSGPASIGKALVGGAFGLTDHMGNRVTDKSFPGKYLLVFFGYTSCPDVCPGGLQTVSAALDEMGRDADMVQPLFITIDPARDTVPVMKDYVSNFHPRLIGLTGTDAEIATVAKAYRVFYGRPKGEEVKADYLMDHTAIFYLMAPDGSFATHVSYGTSARDMAAKITSAIGAK